MPVLFTVMVWAALEVPTLVLLKVRLVGETLIVGLLVEPVRLIDLGPLMALSARLTVAVRFPAAVGVNVTLIVHVPLAATELPHVLVTAKSPGSAPVVVIPVIDKLAFPVLVRVTDCAALATPTPVLVKVREVAERLMAEAVPVPDKAIASGLTWRLSAMLTVAVRVPMAVGVNSTVIVQVPLAASDPPTGQLLVSEKSPGSAPIIVMLEMVKLVLLVLDMITFLAVLVTPTF